jgi:hypothetical protein
MHYLQHISISQVDCCIRYMQIFMLLPPNSLPHDGWLLHSNCFPLAIDLLERIKWGVIWLWVVLSGWKVNKKKWRYVNKNVCSEETYQPLGTHLNISLPRSSMDCSKEFGSVGRGWGLGGGRCWRGGETPFFVSTLKHQWKMMLTIHISPSFCDVSATNRRLNDRPRGTDEAKGGHGASGGYAMLEKGWLEVSSFLELAKWQSENDMNDGRWKLT